MSALARYLNPNRIDFAYAYEVTNLAEGRPSFGHLVKALFYHAAHALVRHSAVIHYISDNGGYHDTARGEIVVRLEDVAEFFKAISGRPEPRIQYHDIPSQDTHAAAFDLAQLARGAIRGFGNIFFVNCSPRIKQRGVQGKNGGETIYVGILPNGAIIGGTGEDAFVHYKDLVKAGELNLYKANIATDDTQFRSRDYFTWLAIVLGIHVNNLGINRRWKKGLNLEQRENFLFGLKIVDRNEKLSADEIPDLPSQRAFVCRADTHGNLKIGLRHTEVVETFKDDSQVVVVANGHALHAVVATDSFEKSQGITAISAGSSGRWRGGENRELSPIAEIFTVGGRARDVLHITDANLKDGVDIHFIPSKLFHDAKNQLSATNERLWNDEQIAQAIVNARLVAGLNHQSLKKIVSEGRIAAYLEKYLPEVAQELPSDYRMSLADRRRRENAAELAAR